jgi:hypothetical protein
VFFGVYDFFFDRYQIALRSHLSNLDNLIEIQHERFDVLESEMLEDTEEVTKDHEAERFCCSHFIIRVFSFREELAKNHELQKNELLQILQLMDDRFDSQMSEDRGVFEEERKAVEEQQRNELMANKTNLSMRIDILTTAIHEVFVYLLVIGFICFVVA